MSSETEATPLLKARRTVKFIDSKDSLDAAVNELESFSGRIAVDAERASGFKYSQRAYLLQLAREQGPIFLIDTAKIEDEYSSQVFTALSKCLSQAEWILHAATQDLPCLAELGLHPKSIFDTELGSRLAGLPRVGLGAVVEHFLNLKLAKEHSAVDWSVRPLDQAWLDYAALDVDVLHEVASALEADLVEKGKLKFALQEFDNLLKFKPKPENPDKWRSISGLHEVKNEIGLSIARSMWQARELLAKKLDVAPGRLIPDSSISHVAKARPKTKPELASDKAFAGRASRTYLDTWWAAIEDGASSKELPHLKVATIGIPNHRSWPNRWPAAHKRLVAVRIKLAELAEQLEMPLENLISPEAVRQVCWIERCEISARELELELQNLGVRAWQIDLVVEIIANQIAVAMSSSDTQVVSGD